MKRANPEQQRRMIAESAYRVLARDGLEGFSMRNVAADAGCTIGLINHWFSSKEALVTTAWHRAIDLEQRRGDALRKGDELPIEAALLSALPTTPELRHKELVWLAFRAMSVSNANVRKAYTRHYDYARGLFTDELVRRGFGRKEAAEKSDLLLVAIDGVAQHALMNPRRWPAAKQRAALLALIEPLLKR
jgi:AcrR family transcriptional regulator